MDDERLKRSAGRDYFDELLARIRDIRSSEKVFWRKVLDIYASSSDYDPDNELSKRFFATVQNKVHWAAHGHTAAEIMRTFVRRLLASHADLARKLAVLKRKYDAQFKVVFDAIRALMTPPEPKKRKPIGFLTEAEK